MTGTLTAHTLTLPRPPRTFGGSGRVGWCVLAALGLHAALGLGLFLRAQALVPGHTGQTPAQTPGPSPSHSAAASARATAMQVRWTLSEPTRIAQADTPAPGMADAPGPAEATAPAQATTGSPAAAPTLDAAVDAPVPAAPTPTSARNDGNGSGNGNDGSSDAPFTGYARRDMLDRPPQALGIVQINYPAGVEPGRVRTGRLTLFIDEAGAVRKVLVVTPPNTADALPAPFVEAAREAFLQARFTPGERQGVPVKSRIDVEVRFDDRETAPLETAQQPQAPAGTDRSV